MSLWDNIKNWARSLWSWVKNLFSSWDTYSDTVTNDKTNDSWKQTLNEQIANWNITKPTTTNTNQTTIQNSGFNALKERLNEPSTPIDTNTIQQTTPKVIEDNEEETFLSKLGKRFKWAGNDIVNVVNKADNRINSTIQGIDRGRIIGDEYDRREEHMAVWYNSNNNDVYYLDLNEDKWLFDWDWGTREWTKDRFEELLVEADRQWRETWDYRTAFNEFYDKAKWLFRIRADDYYWSPFRSGIKRRSDMYTQEQLDSLPSMDKNNKWSYVPTFEEFVDFVSMYGRNSELQNELWIIADEHTPDIENIKLDRWIQSDWMSSTRDIALKNIDEFLNPMSIVNPNAATEARMTYSSYVLNDKLWRRYAQVAPIYRAEQEVLSRDKSTWSNWDWYILEVADKARQMDKQFASNLNELFRQILLYWTDKNWEIVNTPDMFENGESLNDVLTKWLREIAWEDKKWYGSLQSDLDIIQNFANEALYIYNIDKWWPLRRAWNNIEYFFEPVGSTLWEVWQVAFWMTLSALGQDLAAQYMDQDSTVFRMLETDDWNIKRTIKKYSLQALEYTPEVIWNLIPDIALYALTWPWALATTAKTLEDARIAIRASKAAEWASLLNKLRVVNRLGRWVKVTEELWLTANKYREIVDWVKAARNIPQWLKTWVELVDRAATELALWQFMDAQWSAYDTEPYSQASFLMSVIWSWVFDIMPSLTTLVTWKRWWNLLSWDSIWNLTKYIDSSPEAAKNIAAALGKRVWDIWVDDLQAFVKNFWTIEEAAKQAYNWLTSAEKAKIWELTKGLTYSYINQAFGANSTIWKRVRQILSNKNSNLADVVKYIARVPWEVSIWPYVSTIRLKNWTRANIYAIDTTNWYSPVLDSVFDWWFSSRVNDWFSQADLDKLSKVEWYSNIEKNKSKWFYSVTTDGKWTTYYLNKDWLKHFWLRPESITLESLWVTLKEAEDTRAALKQIKWAKWVNISDKAIDDLADTWAYDEITSKVKEVLWC